ncbi:MAG: transglutaminase family protein [Polyangiaceae bacterium]|nr:transglutaminase family protein [Polyangiaceae bacterium]
MKLVVRHRSRYVFPQPAALGPHVIRLRPAPHCKAQVESYGLTIEQPCVLRWQRDPHGNHLARAVFERGSRVEALDIVVELALDARPVNPFDFFVDERCERSPFEYPDGLRTELEPYLRAGGAAYATGTEFEAFVAGLPREDATVSLLVELNRRVAARVSYVIREESGLWTPERTLTEGRGSCRDSATLLIAVLRRLGFAARFCSGYLIQLTDEGMLPDQPRGIDRDVVDLHAWAEVYLLGAGWIGLDATSGLLCGEGHVPLAACALPEQAAPIEGTADHPATSVSFTLGVERLGHRVRPTAPYEEPVWQMTLAASDHVDALLERQGVSLTVGGEPTFNSRLHPELPEWRSGAMGETKDDQGRRLADELRARLCPGALLLLRTGKWYPGEPLPRWALDLVAREDGGVLWPDRAGLEAIADAGTAARFARALAVRLDVEAGLMPAFEDPLPLVLEEERLPPDLDPFDHALADTDGRRQLARALARGLASEVGQVLPLAVRDGRFVTSKWSFRRERLYAVAGDSALGLRLPLASLSSADIYRPKPALPRGAGSDPRRVAPEHDGGAEVRTALVVEPRAGALWVFLPPVERQADFLALVRAIDETRVETGLEVRVDGYAPPPGDMLKRFSVTPDPGVLEVNLPPTRSGREHARLIDTVFDAALHSGLHAEKYLVDGRQAGSGGGNHVTLGGPTVDESPFLRRPELLASLITFVQHHPSLSYLFSGLFVGPTSQAPRVDEARHDSLYELELALARAFEPKPDDEPWLVDALFRNLLVDLAGNTHRSEICIDKLFDPSVPHGCQGLVELRAFEMPPHPRMVTAQVVLVRALIAAFARAPYRARLVRWGQQLHDRFLLPHWLWADFRQVLEYLAERGIRLPEDAYRPFLELRCPVVGRIEADGVELEIRNALEPWPVLGEVATQTGTSRFVDSSLERIEVHVRGLLDDRYAVLVNQLELPLRPATIAGERVAGVRFRAWAPWQSLQPQLGIHHPLRIELVDRSALRSVAAGSYHVWHPEGRAYDSEPLTRFEAEARRLQRFTRDGQTPSPVTMIRVPPHPDSPDTLDLRRFPGDRPAPEPEQDEEPSEVSP